MGNLTWLRSRIWFALALPACEKDDATKPVAHDAALVAKVSVDARTPIDAPPPAPDAAPLAATPDAAPAATDAGPKPLASWKQTREHSCGGMVWCAPRATAWAFAKGKDREEDCPATVKIPADPGVKAPPRGEYAVWADEAKCCVRTGQGGCKGRPFLDGDRAVVAAADPAGDAWIAAALDEHASIASFARATLELMAVGAPPHILAAVQQAALDEIAHAQGCFAMAARHGRAVEPGPIEALAPRGGGLAAVARDTFLEGCVGETIGALIAADARDAAEDPEERALMARIADDEARHAELAWQTVAWAVAREPSIAAALRAAADRARDDSAIWRDVIDPTLARVLA